MFLKETVKFLLIFISVDDILRTSNAKGGQNHDTEKKFYAESNNNQ